MNGQVMHNGCKVKKKSTLVSVYVYIYIVGCAQQQQVVHGTED